jgi:hypothetical protein
MRLYPYRRVVRKSRTRVIHDKVYDKNKINEVAKTFEDFRIVNGISLPNNDDL